MRLRWLPARQDRAPKGQDPQASESGSQPMTVRQAWMYALTVEYLRRTGEPNETYVWIDPTAWAAPRSHRDLRWVRAPLESIYCVRGDSFRAVGTAAKWEAAKESLALLGIPTADIFESVSPSTEEEGNLTADLDRVVEYVADQLPATMLDGLLAFFRQDLAEAVESFPEDPASLNGECLLLAPARAIVGEREGSSFEYTGYCIEPTSDKVTYRYRIGLVDFEEVHGFPSGGNWTNPSTEDAVRLLYLMAGVSYYKTFAPPTVDLCETATTADEVDFLHEFYSEGLGEFGYRLPERHADLFPDGLDLHGITILGGRRLGKATGNRSESTSRSPLIPFGGGLDSVVTVELLRGFVEDPALFIVNRPGDRFDAIEGPAAKTQFQILRAEREIDRKVLESTQRGYLNGHVPVTGIISGMAVVTASLFDRDAVIMSNEWSSSSATLSFPDGRSVNHQYSKSHAFERSFDRLLSGIVGAPHYFSLLRPFTELWIARYFAEHCQEYLHVFRSCNRSFAIDPQRRAERWCAQCDKCAFIDLILSPFIARTELDLVFHGAEPIENPEMESAVLNLLGLRPDSKPWECVGDVTECREAALLASERADRAKSQLLGIIEKNGLTTTGSDALLHPIGNHGIPDRYAPATWLE